MARTAPSWTDAIPWFELNRRDRRSLQRLVTRSSSFPDLLDRLPRSLAHLDDLLFDAYDDWLTDPTPRGAGRGKEPELKGAALIGGWLASLDQVEGIEAAKDWLDRASLGNLAGVSLRELGEAIGVPSWSNHSLRSVVATPWVAHASLDVLAELLRLALDREQQRTLAEHIRRPSPHAALRPAQRFLLEHLEPGALLSAHIQAEFVLEPPELMVGSGSFAFEPLALRRLNQLHVQGLLLAIATDEPNAYDFFARVAATLELGPFQRNVVMLTETLASLAPEPSAGELGWILKDTGGRWQVVPVLCTQRKKGGFKVRELRDTDPRPAMLPADERVASRSTLIGQLDELVGHPRVFVRQERRCDGYPRRVRRVQLQVGLRAHEGATRLGFELDGEPVDVELLSGVDRVHSGWWVHPTDDAILVAPMPHAMIRLHELLRRRAGELLVPDGGALLQAMPWLPEALPIDADPETLGAPVPADVRPVLRLTFEGTVLHVEARVQPLPEAPSSVPGEGSPLQLGQRAGAAVYLRRELAAEPEQVRQALAPLELPSPEAPFAWRIDDLQQALSVVERLRDHTDRVRVEWGGDRPRLASRPAVAGDLSLQVRAKRDWFGLQGTISVDGHDVRLQSLLDAAIEGHPWVPLSDGQWLRLADDLRHQLAAAAAASMRSKGDDAGLQAVHAPLLDPLVEAGATLDAPPEWLSYAQRCREAATLEPQVPDGLQATLRPYQLEGVRWLLRLAHWAPGAVLADDMGLGKTVQTIALLLARSERPSLVVAPTSLLHNWQRELERFAPSLGVDVYHGNRRSLEPAPGRVILTTYGVLVQDAEALSTTSFGTAVFDEAHAVKNPSSQRSKAARELDAAFVVGLTGTPVENRVGDLWALFRVVVPGLLGSAGRFRERFVVPIEGQGDTRRRADLAQLVAPFILRRTKRQVASDLPARTELVHRVVLSPAERTLYDRTRLASLARLESAGQGKRMRILEELLRLRKLACHPKLFDATSEVPSSKLKAVRRLVADVRESGQRMLLFSTFTSHLALIREALEADGVPLRYLDGSLSPSQRVAEVDAFQAGQGDVFLISTKAGGVGLNLTAATVVAHVDPWWNPASEDQATDRAHRIGQTDPVTVVRFVSAGTIEEQIVELHATKRELADALLAHSGSSRPVRLEELVALLSDEGGDPLEEPASVPEAFDDGPVLSIQDEPVASVEAAPPIHVEALAPAALEAGDPQALLDGFQEVLDAARAREEFRSDNTVRAYHRAMRNFLVWHDGPLDVDSLEEAGRAYVAAAKAGKVPHKSDKVYARPALRRLLAWLRGSVQR